MAEYDFQTLSSFDFQVLSRDLLQKNLGVVLESFGPGKDGGVDYRLSYTGRTGISSFSEKKRWP